MLYQQELRRKFQEFIIERAKEKEKEVLRQKLEGVADQRMRRLRTEAEEKITMIEGFK